MRNTEERKAQHRDTEKVFANRAMKKLKSEKPQKVEWL